YRGGTSTRKSDAAPKPVDPSPVLFKTHHARQYIAHRGARRKGHAIRASGFDVILVNRVKR
ncbi:MAG: hypothetical protein JXO72_12420, partial [Vicinamibacteria bacterium]|nr:hypothetical protein [Vicinamibacteria bacterium]